MPKIELTWLGHNAWRVKIGAGVLLIDPFFAPKIAPCSADDITADYLLVSHGHADHCADALSIAKRCSATVTAMAEVAGWFADQGVKKTEPMNIGGAIPLALPGGKWRKNPSACQYDPRAAQLDDAGWPPWGERLRFFALDSESWFGWIRRRGNSTAGRNAFRRIPSLLCLRYRVLFGDGAARNARTRRGGSADRRPLYDGTGGVARRDSGAASPQGDSVTLQYLAGDRAKRRTLGRRRAKIHRRRTDPAAAWRCRGNGKYGSPLGLRVPGCRWASGAKIEN